jgi:hypothetical protein
MEHRWSKMKEKAETDERESVVTTKLNQPEGV